MDTGQLLWTQHRVSLELQPSLTESQPDEGVQVLVSSLLPLTAPSPGVALSSCP